MFGLGLKARAHKATNLARDHLRNLVRPRLLMKGSHENIAVVFSEPHDMPIGDRIVLYGLIRGLKPKTYLEVGVRWGGSARIVANAMQANGFGKAVGLDPDLSAFRPRRSELHGRYTMRTGYSPEDTGKAAKALPAPVDFAFIDAVHTYAAVKADLEGVLPFLAESAHILLHDAFHQGIDQAVLEFLEKHPEFQDLGILSKNADVGLPVSYAGLRLLRRGPTPFLTDLSDAHARAGLEAPKLDPETWNFDPYANRIGDPMGRKND